MSLLRSIRAFYTGTYVVTRRSGGTWSSGKWTPGAPSTFNLRASIQPATGMQRVVGGKDMRTEVDGQHVDDVRIVFTERELYVRRNDREPDKVTFDGDTWTVFRIEPWDHSGVKYWRAVITRDVKGAS